MGWMGKPEVSSRQIKPYKHGQEGNHMDHKQRMALGEMVGNEGVWMDGGLL